MRKTLLFSFISLIALFGSSAALPAQAINLEHKRFTCQLEKYVKNGLVDYAAWKSNRAELLEYLASLEKIKSEEFESLSPNDKEAFWINAYNACTIKLVLDHYPIEGQDRYYPKNSIRQIRGFWEDKKFSIAGREVSLYDIEHNILRREIHDPRTHFAVVCAAIGCADLKEMSYQGISLDRDLDDATRNFLAQEKHVSIDSEKKIARVSKIFLWFPLDFLKATALDKRFPPPSDDEIVLKYIYENGPESLRARMGDKEKLAEYTVIYRTYDWSLNDKSAP